MNKPTLESILASPRLPTLPAVALRVIELTRASGVELTEIAELIQNDQALAAKVLRTVNSSYYGLRKPCSTIRQSLNYLGLNAVKSLALGFSLVDTIHDPEDVTFDFVQYWRRGIYSAVGARQAAEAAQLPCADEAFLGALMQDLGMVVLYRALGDIYLQIIDLAEGDHARLAEVETRKLDFDHAKVGRAIAERWKLPPQLQAAIAHHHEAHTAPKQWRPLAQAVSLGGHAAEALAETPANGALPAFRRKAGEWFKLTEGAASQLLESIASGATELATLFQLNTGSAPDVQGLLAEAESLLIEHEVAVDRVTSELRQTNSLLQEQMLTDDLTGAGNRRGFEQRLSRLFPESQKRGTPLGLVLLVIDRFEPICDAHGSEIGDRVLAEAADRMIRHIGDRGMVCRRRGEEFALLLPGADRVETARLAESLRRAMESEPMELPETSPPGTLNISITAGAAAYQADMAAVLPGPDRLVHAADQALCAAKASGRNCVRIFNPLRKPAAT